MVHPHVVSRPLASSLLIEQLFLIHFSLITYLVAPTDIHSTDRNISMSTNFVSFNYNTVHGKRLQVQYVVPYQLHVFPNKVEYSVSYQIQDSDASHTCKQPKHTYLYSIMDLQPNSLKVLPLISINRSYHCLMVSSSDN